MSFSELRMTVWRTRSPSKGAISISAMASNMILSSRAPLQAPGRSCRQSPFCKFAVKQASMRIRVWRASSCFSYQASASQSMTLGSFIDEPGMLVANQYGKFPATLGFMGLRARGHYNLASQMDAGPSRTGAPLRVRGFVRAVTSRRGWRRSLCCPFALQTAV